MNPWRALATRDDVQLEIVDLPGDMLGCCCPHAGIILLRRGLTQRQRRAVLAHELCHLERGPVPDHPHLAAREERAVEVATARALIDLDDLAEALSWSRDEHELAVELWTDVATVRDRLRFLTPAERHALQQRLDLSAAA